MLDRGRVAEHGRRVDLAGRPTSRYAALLRATAVDDVLDAEATA